MLRIPHQISVSSNENLVNKSVLTSKKAITTLFCHIKENKFPDLTEATKVIHDPFKEGSKGHT